jgi:branched-subunit amino acid transport protein
VALTYLTPLFYPLEALPETVAHLISTYNPLYYFIAQARAIFLGHQWLPGTQMLLGFGAGALLMILGMALVTYIPRALPAIWMERLRFGPRFEKFLNLIPYTAMAALIYPGILTVDTGRPWVGLVGAAAAAVPALRRRPVMLCVLAAIAAELVVYLLLGT